MSGASHARQPPTHSPTADTTDPATAGQFVAAFVERTGEVSVVFQRALRDRFERHLGSVAGRGWYDTAAVAAALRTVADEAGPATLRKGGREWARTLDDCDARTVTDALAALSSAHADIHRTRGDGSVGRYRAGTVSDRQVRVAVSDDYPYPPAFAEGVFLRVARAFGPPDAVPSVERTTVRGDETAAWRLAW